MTYLLFQIGGNLEGCGIQLKKEGHDVFFYKQKGMLSGREDTGMGIFDKTEMIDDVFEVINKFQDKKNDLIIITDDNGYGDEIDFLRNNGFKVIGGNAFIDKIEYERGFGTKIMKEIGLPIPDEHKFNTIDEGIAFVEKQKDDVRFVFKADGEGFAGNSSTYTGKNRQDLLDYMKWTKEHDLAEHTNLQKFLLQEFVEGIEADFSAYFNGEDFMKGSIMIDIEEKKANDGDKGMAEGCMGNIVLFIEQSPYFENYLQKLTPLLRKINYVGCIAINNIFAKGTDKYKEGQPYGLEFTPRLGWDAHPTEMQLIKENGGKISDFYIALVNRKDFSFPYDKVGCGVRLYTGSVALEKKEVAGRYFSFDKSIEDNLWFYSVSKKEEGYVIEDNPVMCVNTTGETLQKAIDGCYARIDKINIPDIAYRNEIGKRAKEALTFLHKYGWV